MNDWNLEHPDVTRVLRDGYVREPRAVCSCSECGEPIYEGERALHVTGWGWICESCIEALTEEVVADD